MESSSPLELLISPIRNVFYYHKKKLAFFILALLLFTVVLFPYSDLTSFSKEKINHAIKPSGSSVDYSNIGFNLIPFGVQTTDFELSSRSLKTPLKLKSITLRPNLLSFAKLQPGGTAVLDGLFAGLASLSFSLNGKTAEQTQKFNLDADVKNISLPEIIAFQKLPYKIKGNLNGNMFASGEESFRVQPKGEFKFNLRNVILPEVISIPNFGDLTLPKKVVWQNSNLFGKFEKGKITIQEGTLGTKTAPMNGRYKGYLNCSFHKSGQSCTDYSFKVEIELSAEFQRSLLAGLKSFMNPRNVNIISLPQGGSKYLFSVQGNAAQRFRAPKISSLTSFD